MASFMLNIENKILKFVITEKMESTYDWCSVVRTGREYEIHGDISQQAENCGELRRVSGGVLFFKE